MEYFMNRQSIRPFDYVQTLIGRPYWIVSIPFKQLFASIHRKIPQEHDGIPNIVLLVSFKLSLKNEKIVKNWNQF